MKKKIFVCAFIFALVLNGTAFAEIISESGIAVVETEAGKIQGYIRNGIFTYHGVPYAEAELFMPPTKLKSWEGIKLALNYGPMSPQDTTPEGDMFPFHYYWPLWEGRNYAQSNNCQNLNIWTPAIDNAKRPVMVWLHGGGFEAGNSAAEDVYDGENLSRKGDVVVVSINHRLNVLGFLDLSAYGEEYKYSGNLRMLDIIAALEQSGAVDLMGITFPEQRAARRVAALTLEKLNITPEKIAEIKNVPYSKLSEAANKAMAQAVKEGEKIYSWSPVKDGDLIPDDIGTGGFMEQVKNIPLIVGSTLNEWETVPLLVNMDKNQSDNKNFWNDEKINSMLKKKYGNKADAIASEFLKAYPHKKKADALYVEFWIREGALRILNAKAKQNGAPVYSYIFTWETPVMGGYAMAYHCSELPFVFNNIALSEKIIGGRDKTQALADKMSQAWIDFARTSNPGWEAYTKDNGATIIFDNESSIAYNHYEELLKLLMFGDNN